MPAGAGAQASGRCGHHKGMNRAPVRRRTPKIWHWAAYAAMIAAAVIAFVLIRGYGETLVAPPPEAAAVDRLGAGGGAGDVFFHVLLALAAVIATGRVLGRLLARLG